MMSYDGIGPSPSAVHLPRFWSEHNTGRQNLAAVTTPWMLYTIRMYCSKPVSVSMWIAMALMPLICTKLAMALDGFKCLFGTI